MAQAIGNRTSMFEINFFRFALQSLVGLAVVLYAEESLRIAKKDIYKLIIGVPFSYVKCTVFYLAAVIMPVGDMDGIFVALYIIFSTGFDLGIGRISKISLLSSGLGVIGVIFLCQPWHPWDTSNTPEFAPCDLLANKSLMALHHNSSHHNNTTMSMVEVKWYSNKYILGILYIILTAASCTVSGNIFKSLLTVYPVYSIVFWTGFLQCIPSGIILVSLRYFGNGHLSFPVGGVCLALTVLFICSLTCITVSGKFVYKALPVSKAALAISFGALALYIVQRTLLKDFYPGHANALEIIGIVFIFACASIAPIISIMYESKSESGDN